MGILVVIFGLLSGSLWAVLIGLLGRQRNIGFGWAFVLSLLLTPLIGLLITLLSDKKSIGQEKNWGCVAGILAVLALAFLVSAFVLLGTVTFI